MTPRRWFTRWIVTAAVGIPAVNGVISAALADPVRWSYLSIGWSAMVVGGGLILAVEALIENKPFDGQPTE